MTIDAALSRLSLGDPAGALALLRPSDDAADGNATEHAARGMILLAADRPDDARAALRLAVALGADDPATLLNLALAEDRGGDRARARRLMHRVAEAE